MLQLSEEKFMMLLKWQKAAIEFDAIGSWSMAEFCRVQVLRIAKGEV